MKQIIIHLSSDYNGPNKWYMSKITLHRINHQRSIKLEEENKVSILREWSSKTILKMIFDFHYSD